MENDRNLSIARRLAVERQLLREEKYIVHALKTVKEERHALQREGTDLLCLLNEVLTQGDTSNAQRQQARTQTPTASKVTPAMDKVPSMNEAAFSLLDEIELPCMDDIVSNEVELNLTVPSHNFYDQMPEQEFEEVETEDDFEIEMSMLMNGEKTTY